MEPREDAPTLAELGLDKKTSAVAQKLAELSPEAFDQVKIGNETVAKAIAATKPQKPIDKLPPVIPFPDEFGKLKAEYLELFEAHTEQGKTIKELLDENNSMAAIIDANDQLAAVAAENKKLREMNRILEERVRGLQGECAAAKRAAQSWQRKAEKAA